MNCNSEKNLQIHHLSYTGKHPWEAPDNDLIVVCRKCHESLHNKGEFTSLKAWELIYNFNSQPDLQDYVTCLKGGNFIGNFNLEDASKRFKAKKESIIKCCQGKTKLCSGYTWRFSKIKQTFNSLIYYKPTTQLERIYFLLGINRESELFNAEAANIISKRDLNFVSHLLTQNKLSLDQKVSLIQISNKILNNGRT